MSMPKVKLNVYAIPKSVVRVGVAGDFLKNLSLGSLEDNIIGNIQQGVAEGLISALVVTGVDGHETPRARFRLTFDPLTDDTKVTLDIDGGKSTIEAVDVGLAGAIAAAVELLRRRRLSPRVTFDWSAQATSNPSRLDEAKGRLGFCDVAPLQPVQDDAVVYSANQSSPMFGSHPLLSKIDPPPGYDFESYLTITPGKDPGIHFFADRLRRRP